MPLQLPGTPANTVQVPTTSAELQAMQLRRSELTQQLGSLSDSRQRLTGERFAASANQNQAIVAELDGRVKELGVRIVRIEREKLSTDDAIAAALARGVASDQALSPGPAVVTIDGPPQVITIPGDLGSLSPADIRKDYERMMAMEALTFILLGFFGWRWAKRRWERQRAREVTVETGASKELKDAVYAMAVEIERISENQRFVTKLLSEKPQVERDPARVTSGSPPSASG